MLTAHYEEIKEANTDQLTLDDVKKVLKEPTDDQSEHTVNKLCPCCSELISFDNS